MQAFFVRTRTRARAKAKTRVKTRARTKAGVGARAKSRRRSTISRYDLPSGHSIILLDEVRCEMGME